MSRAKPASPLELSCSSAFSGRIFTQPAPVRGLLVRIEGQADGLAKVGSRRVSVEEDVGRRAALSGDQKLASGELTHGTTLVGVKVRVPQVTLRVEGDSSRAIDCAFSPVRCADGS